MIKLILVEDELPALEIMQTYLRPLEKEVNICGAYSSLKDAIKNIQLHQPDILVLDIELNDGLSFELLEIFPELNARIIFVTAHDDYMLRAIKSHAFDYLLKPVVEKELQEAIKNAVRDIENKSPKQNKTELIDFIKNQSASRIAVPNRSGLNYYNLEDIVYIEADGSYSIIHFNKQNKTTVSRKVKDFETSLSNRGFLRVHKSYLVNTSHVVQLHREDSGYLILSDRSRIPISPKDKELIIQRIKQFCTII